MSGLLGGALTILGGGLEASGKADREENERKQKAFEKRAAYLQARKDARSDLKEQREYDKGLLSGQREYEDKVRSEDAANKREVEQNKLNSQYNLAQETARNKKADAEREREWKEEQKHLDRESAEKIAGMRSEGKAKDTTKTKMAAKEKIRELMDSGDSSQETADYINYLAEVAGDDKRVKRVKTSEGSKGLFGFGKEDPSYELQWSGGDTGPVNEKPDSQTEPGNASSDFDSLYGRIKNKRNSNQPSQSQTTREPQIKNPQENGKKLLDEASYEKKKRSGGLLQEAQEDNGLSGLGSFAANQKKASLEKNYQDGSTIDISRMSQADLLSIIEDLKGQGFDYSIDGNTIIIKRR